MKITHYLEPRQSGKSTFAKQLQMEDPENTLLFTYGKNGAPFFLKTFCGVHPKKIIIDDYILRYLQNKEKVENWMRSNVIPAIEKDGELILISTPQKMYSKECLMLAQLVNYPAFMPPTTPLFDTNEILKEIKEIRGSFLNASEVEIKRNTLSTFLTKEHLKEDKTSLGEMVFNIQYKAQIFY